MKLNKYSYTYIIYNILVMGTFSWRIDWKD